MGLFTRFSSFRSRRSDLPDGAAANKIEDIQDGTSNTVMMQQQSSTTSPGDQRTEGADYQGTDGADVSTSVVDNTDDPYTPITDTAPTAVDFGDELGTESAAPLPESDSLFQQLDEVDSGVAFEGDGLLEL